MTTAELGQSLQDIGSGMFALGCLSMLPMFVIGLAVLVLVKGCS